MATSVAVEVPGQGADATRTTGKKHPQDAKGSVTDDDETASTIRDGQVGCDVARILATTGAG